MSAIVIGGLIAVSFLFRPRAPPPKMEALARRVAQERGVALPLTTLRSFYRTRRFLNQHSRDWFPPLK
ncbi:MULTISPECIES: hypothetical protein [Burkholderiaceae]|uniref:hypothetical protein n=1 Tax=Burkholderiaceae TaxID=119060 RepID=UPI00161A976F|nr:MULTISPECIES: hypothetical protein [Burkholderiaceae]MBB2981394.1 hypothetical protein [Paraburkholderia tropica]